MKNILNISFAVFVAFALAFPGAAQGSKGDNTFGSAQFDRTVYDFGDIMLSDGPVTAVFNVKNIGDKAIVLYNVVSSCGCTDVKWSKAPIKAGEQGKIEATYSNDEGAHPFDKALTVYISGEKKPVVLRLRGESHARKMSLAENYPVHFGNFAVKSSAIKGGNMAQGQQKSGEVKVANLGSSPIDVKFKDVSQFLSLKLSLNPIPAGGTATLSYTVTADRSLWGKNYYYATPVVNGKVFKAKVLEAAEPGKPVAGGEAIYSDPDPELGSGHEKIGIFTITKENFASWPDEKLKNCSQPMFSESSCSFGKVKAGTVLTGKFDLTNKGKDVLKIYKADSESTHIKVEPAGEVAPGRSSSLRFTLNTGGLPGGEVLMVINLYTNSPLRPMVTLYVTGWIDD